MFPAIFTDFGLYVKFKTHPATGRLAGRAYTPIRDADPSAAVTATNPDWGHFAFGAHKFLFVLIAECSVNLRAKLFGVCDAKVN